MFMFLAPMLYFFHALLTGAAMAVCYSFGILHGFGFSAGLIDYLLNWKLATNPVMIIPVGLVFAGIYYSVFSWAIKKYDILTPGRYDESEEAVLQNAELGTLPAALLAKLGGSANVESLDSCITRLRMTVKNADIIQESELKALGISGMIRKGNNLQVIVGTKAELIADEIKKLLAANKNINM
jgi:PTS system N-acetylglucosamine-specific IIC component